MHGPLFWQIAQFCLVFYNQSNFCRSIFDQFSFSLIFIGQHKGSKFTVNDLIAGSDQTQPCTAAIAGYIAESDKTDLHICGNFERIN